MNTTTATDTQTTPSVTLKDQCTAISGVFKIVHKTKNVNNFLNDALDHVDCAIGEYDDNGLSDAFKSEFTRALTNLLHVGTMTNINIEVEIAKILKYDIDYFKRQHKL
jgi:hypothetical protein